MQFDIIIYDTEITAWEGSLARNWSGESEFKEIIQVSAIKVEINTETIITKQEYSEFIKPSINHQLSDYIQDLTGINQNEIDSGASSEEMFSQLKTISENGSIPLFSWGNDLHVLKETAKINNINLNPIQSYDLKKLFQAFGECTNVSSGMLYQRYTKDIELNEHNAIDDCLSLLHSMEALHKEAPEKVITTLQEISLTA